MNGGPSFKVWAAFFVGATATEDYLLGAVSFDSCWPRAFPKETCEVRS
jgi:hypothetical protein